MGVALVPRATLGHGRHGAADVASRFDGIRNQEIVRMAALSSFCQLRARCEQPLPFREAAVTSLAGFHRIFCPACIVSSPTNLKE